MKAIIIGGGIGGLCAGIALQRAGHDVTIFEQANELRAVGAGITIWANALTALTSLGLGEQLRAVGKPSNENAIRTANGTVLSNFDAAALRAKLGVPELLLGFHRAELHHVLLAQCDPAALQTGATCTGFSEEGEQIVAHFADGSRVAGDYLIGADGIHSVIRAQLHGKHAPTYAGYTAWRAVIPFDHAALLPGESWGRGTRFGQLALTAGRVYWFAAHNEPEGARATGGEKERLRLLLDGWHAPIPALIDATPEALILRHDIYDRPPLTWWGQGRVTLLGDAAHPMTPNLGQGACQAIEDAVVLGRAVAAQRDIPTALRSYEQQRIPRTSALTTQARQIGQVGQWQQPLLVALRDTAMRLLPAQLQIRQLAATLTFPG